MRVLPHSWPDLNICTASLHFALSEGGLALQPARDYAYSYAVSVHADVRTCGQGQRTSANYDYCTWGRSPRFFNLAHMEEQ